MYYIIIYELCLQMKEAEDKLKEARREELEQLQLRKAADEVFQQNEMEKMGLQHEEIQKQKEFLFSQMVSLEIISDAFP